MIINSKEYNEKIDSLKKEDEEKEKQIIKELREKKTTKRYSNSKKNFKI